MSISSAVQWDVRSSGSDSNGGGFDTTSSGTDFSQQDSPQVTYTDLVIGATNTQLTSAGNPFTSAHVGNVLNVTGGSGFTIARYQVLSVASNVATVDRAVGTATSTGGTGNLGGAVANFYTVLSAVSAANLGAGYQALHVHVKAGTYTLSSTKTLTVQSSNAGWDITGYGTTHGDGGTKPLFTTSTNSTVLFELDSGSPFVFSNISFSNTASTRATGFNSVNGNSANPDLFFVDCILDGFTNALDADNSSGTHYQLNSLNLIRTEVKNCTSDGMTVCIIGGGAGLNIIDSWIHDNTGIGLKFVNDNSGITANLSGSIFSTNGSRGFSMSSTGLGWLNIDRSAFKGNTGDGVFVNNIQKNRGIRLANTWFWGNGGWGINAQADTTTLQTASGANVYNNAFGNNTSGDRNHVAVGHSDVTLSADPTMTSTNFAPNATPGGGPVLIGAGSPGNFPGGSTSSGLSIGPAQSGGSGGGGGGLTNYGFIG